MKRMSRSRRSYDPVTLAVHWNRLIAIVDEASATLLRTAFSRIVTDAWDFTCALFDEDGRMIAQPTQGLPSFIGALATAVSHFLRAFPPASLAPGDSLVTNDPWIGTSQLNDMVFVSPAGVVGTYALGPDDVVCLGLSGDAPNKFACYARAVAIGRDAMCEGAMIDGLRLAAETMRYCVATTTSLFEVVRAQHDGNESEVRAYRERLLSTDGLIE